MRFGPAEIGQHAVADVAGDETAEARDRRSNTRLVVADHAAQIFGVRDDSAVEPITSQNITLSWRRSATNSGVPSSAEGAVVCAGESLAALPGNAAIAFQELATMPDGGDAKLFKVLPPSGWEEPRRLRHFAGMLVRIFKTQLSQPVCDFHRRPPASSH